MAGDAALSGDAPSVKRAIDARAPRPRYQVEDDRTKATRHSDPFGGYVVSGHEDKIADIVIVPLTSDNPIILMKTLLVPLLVVFVSRGHAAEIDLGPHGTLSLDAPEGWSIRSEPAIMPDGKPIGRMIELKPPREINAKCLVSLVYSDTGSPDQSRLRRQVLEACERFVEGSVERKKNLRDFALKKGYGAYCVFTDSSLAGKAPEEGNYKVLASGLIEPGNDLVGVVSIFADDGNGIEFQAMLKAINSLDLKAGTPAGGGNAIPIPGQGWKVTFDAPPIKNGRGGSHGDDYEFRGSNGRLNVSLFVEAPKKAGGGNKECYEFYWPKSALHPLIKHDSVKVSHTDKFYRVEYLIQIPENGIASMQTNVNYYFAFEGKWVDLHISALGASQAEAAIIKRIDESLAYEQDPE